MWGLGCEPEFDTRWKALDCQVLVEFSIDSKAYKVKRYKDFISLKEDDLKYVDYEKITGDFAVRMSEILQFKALLKSRTDVLEIPPPAFYFLPFYIDQKRSWAKAWDNFDNLGQYASWKSTIVKYHVGLLKPEHFEFETDKFEIKEEQNEFQEHITKIDTALEIVEAYIPEATVATIDSKQLEKLTDEIKVDLSALQANQEKALDKLTQLHSEKVYLEQQIILTKNVILDLDKDYKFSIENIDGDEIECPLCGIVHENTIINRASIMTDKVQAENQLDSLNKSLQKINNSVNKSNQSLDEIKSQINEINDKYQIEESDSKIDVVNIIESIAGNSIKQNVLEDKNSKIIKIDALEDEIKDIKKEQKKLISKEEIEDVNKQFLLTFKKYLDILEAESVNLSLINSPLDYNKVIKEGGAAEGSRAILAYYLTVFNMVNTYKNEVVSPLIIDTPNQHEQSHSNYDKIVSLITDEVDDSNQVFLCAMENNHLEKFRKNAKVFKLDKTRLLDEKEFDKIKKEFEE
jgi:hypothetical protein